MAEALLLTQTGVASYRLEQGEIEMDGFIAGTITGNIVVSAGATGTIITVPAVVGKRVKLSLLVAETDQTNLLTISAGGVPVVTAINLDNGNYDETVGLFHILCGANEVISEVGEGITVTTNVATSSDTTYQYQIER